MRSAPEEFPKFHEAAQWRDFRAVAVVVAGALAFFGIVLLAYELAVARVPQHRAALERLVRSQTGLDIRFDELGLRWGWYGPEAVFRRVELGEPGRSTVLLQAPELIAGFDVWQTLRSGQLQAGRITLVAADIDLVGASSHQQGRGRATTRPAPAGDSLADRSVTAATAADRFRILKDWHGGRVDLEGGTLRLPDPDGAGSPLTFHIRRASFRHLTSEWSGYGLVFLPERLGRTARVVMRVDGNFQQPATLSGSLRFEGRRLVLAGWRELLSTVPDAGRYLPSAGAGDVSLEVEFTRGQLAKASGKVSVGGLELSTTEEPSRTVLSLDHLRGDWRLAKRESGWRLQVDSLELGESAGTDLAASLSLDAAPTGSWIRGTLEQAPLKPVAMFVRWLSPELDVSGIGLDGVVRNITFDWSVGRPVGQRLRTTARLVDVSVAPPMCGFVLTGLAGQVYGDESALTTELQARTARLELAQAPGHPLENVRVATLLQLSREPNSWRIRAEKLELQHQGARLRIDGSLLVADSSEVPEIDARAELTGTDVPQLKQLAGGGGTQGFGATLSQLTAGSIERASVDLRGPLDATAANMELSGALVLNEAALSGGELWPEARNVQARLEFHGSRVRALLEDARLLPVAGIPSIEGVRGTLLFEDGHLRRSVLTGSWLGGPVTLNIGERHERGALALAIQGRGMLDARQLALAATAGTVIDETRAPTGHAEWTGELAYVAASESKPGQWRVRVDSGLVGIASSLPEPLGKLSSATVPLHIEAQGTATEAQLRLSLGERLRSVLALRHRDDATWRVERGDVQFGPAPAVLPEEPMVLVEGRVRELDLPAYVLAWQQLRAEPAAPAIRADLMAGELLVAGHVYTGVRVLADRTDAGADLRLQSPQMLGTAQWPVAPSTAHPARFHFARLNVPDEGAFGASAELIAALGPATDFSVDDIIWEGRSIGSAAATITSGGNVVDVTDLRLTGSTQDVTGTMHCQNSACRLKFNLDSGNAAATLADFGFRPDLTATRAVLDGDLEWRVGTDRPALATLTGRLNMRLEDGTTRVDPDPTLQGSPFALLLVPALVSGMGQPATQAPSLPASERALRFSRLEADFDVSDGYATSNLHFDGDAEILMRGRTGLLARDYDEQVWVLRGEGRLPAAVRRLRPTPRVAAAWLSLRELFAGGREEGSKAPLHLQGSWDDPIVVASE
jgi:uncharacterized protein YhdP